MPIYQYLCECKEIYEELFLSLKNIDIEEKELKCPICGSSEKKKLIGDSAIIFKGSGWTPRSRTDRSQDSTSGIRDQIKQLKEDAKGITSSDLYDTEKINKTQPQDTNKH